MDVQRYEYKVAYVDLRGRISAEGHETNINEGERNSAFGRRYLNSLGTQGWELAAIHPLGMSQTAYYVFKRALAAGAEPEAIQAAPKQEAPAQPSTPAAPASGAQPTGQTFDA